MFLRLLKIEVQRGLFRIRTLLVLVGIVVFDSWAIMTVAQPFWEHIATANGVTFILPLLVGFIAGDSFVLDRHNSYSWLVLTRGVSKMGYLMCKIAGGAIVCLASAFVVYASFFAVAAVKEGGIPSSAGTAPGVSFHPELLCSSPLLYTFFIFLLAVLSCVAMLGLTYVFSAYTNHPFTAMSLPLLGLFPVSIAIPATLSWLNPYMRITYTVYHQPWVNMPDMVLYWLVFGGILYTWTFIKYRLTDGI